MHTHWAETAPLAPLLVPIGELAGWYIVIGLIAIITALTVALVWVIDHTVGGLPFGIGSFLSSGAHAIQQKITNELGKWAASVDAKIGAAQHQLARVIDWLGEEIARHANLLATLAQLVLGETLGKFYAGLIRTLFHRSNVQAAQIQAITRTLDIQGARSRHGHGEVAIPRVGRIEHGYADVFDKEIAGIRAREKALEGGAIKTWDWIRTHPRALASTAFAGAVAWALARLGGGWIRCTNWNRIGRSVCGVPTNEIESLLGLLVGGAALLEFRELVKLAQSVEHGVASGLQDVAKL